MKNKEGQPALKKKTGPGFIDANVTYELEALPLSTTPVNHILDFSGEIRIKEIPIGFQGFFQRNKDPYLDYNLSNFTTSFDVRKWRKTIRDKVDKQYEKERDSLLMDFPEYRSFSNKKDYVDRVIKNPGALKDLAAIDSLSNLMDDLKLTDPDDLIAYQDSLNVVMAEQRKDLAERIDSTTNLEQRDSLEQRVATLKRRIKKIERLSKLISKKKAYDNLNKIKKESIDYLQKADSVAANFDQGYRELLNQPNKINKYLRKHNLAGSKYMLLLNHVSEFRIGNINPAYSRLVLQNSQIKGLALGVEYGRWGIAGFSGNLTNSDLNLIPDSLSTEIKVMGTKISYAKAGKLKNDFFLVTANQTKSFGEKTRQSIIGHTSTYQLDEQHLMEFEVAYAMDDTGVSTEVDQNNWEKTVRALAGISTYLGASKNNKLSWNTEVEYYGPEYFDFNNPFLINNSIEASGNIRYSILKGMQLGLSTLYNKGNLWQTENLGRRQTISQGLNASYFHEKWPAIQYVINDSKIEGGNYTLNSLFQNVNLSKSYALKDIQLQSLLNTTLLKNDSPLDSLDSRLVTVYASQEARLTKHIRMIAAFNYFNLKNLKDGQQLDLSYELKMPFNFDRLNIDPGIKWVSNDFVKEFGWSLNVSWLLTKELSLNVFVNSLWLNGTIDEFGLIKNEYTPHVSGRINYRF